MERTLDNIEKLSLEIVDQMDMETLIAAALEFTYDFYHKKTTQQEFDDAWGMMFGEESK